MENIRDWLALNAVSGVGPQRFQMLLARFGSPEAALNASTGELLAVPGLGPHTASLIRKQRDYAFADRQLDMAERLGARLITLHDPEYPAGLREIFDPPPVLYLRGQLIPDDERALAVVGTRRTSAYGRQAAELFSRALCEAGLTVVSGLARGVDTVAHRTALSSGGRTVAVMGAGLDRPYPLENHALMDAIAESGAVVTEQPFGTGPDAMNFPMRNRIISGMSLGTLIVEAGETSGALITARYAIEHDREIFAIPGPLTASSSIGTNRLIQNGVAKLVLAPSDILEELAPKIGAARVHDETPAVCRQLSLLPEEEKVWGILDDSPQHIDRIANLLNITTSQALGVLLSLELKEAARQTPGMHFLRLA